MQENLCGEGVYETYYEAEKNGPGAQKITRRVGTVRAVMLSHATGFMLLIADEDGNLVTKLASDVHLRRLPKVP